MSTRRHRTTRIASETPSSIPVPRRRRPRAPEPRLARGTLISPQSLSIAARVECRAIDTGSGFAAPRWIRELTRHPDRCSPHRSFCQASRPVLRGQRRETYRCDAWESTALIHTSGFCIRRSVGRGAGTGSSDSMLQESFCICRSHSHCRTYCRRDVDSVAIPRRTPRARPSASRGQGPNRRGSL